MAELVKVTMADVLAKLNEVRKGDARAAERANAAVKAVKAAWWDLTADNRMEVKKLATEKGLESALRRLFNTPKKPVRNSTAPKTSETTLAELKKLAKAKGYKLVKIDEK